MYFANLSVLFLSNYYLVLLLGDLDFSVITHSYFMFGKRLPYYLNLPVIVVQQIHLYIS